MDQLEKHIYFRKDNFLMNRFMKDQLQSIKNLSDSPLISTEDLEKVKKRSKALKNEKAAENATNSGQKRKSDPITGEEILLKPVKKAKFLKSVWKNHDESMERQDIGAGDVISEEKTGVDRESIQLSMSQLELRAYAKVNQETQNAVVDAKRHSLKEKDLIGDVQDLNTVDKKLSTEINQRTALKESEVEQKGMIMESTRLSFVPNFQTEEKTSGLKAKDSIDGNVLDSTKVAKKLSMEINQKTTLKESEMDQKEPVMESTRLSFVPNSQAEELNLTESHNTLIPQGSTIKPDPSYLEKETEYFTNYSKNEDDLMVTKVEIRNDLPTENEQKTGHVECKENVFDDSKDYSGIHPDPSTIIQLSQGETSHDRHSSNSHRIESSKSITSRHAMPQKSKTKVKNETACSEKSQSEAIMDIYSPVGNDFVHLKSTTSHRTMPQKSKTTVKIEAACSAKSKAEAIMDIYCPVENDFVNETEYSVGVEHEETKLDDSKDVDLYGLPPLYPLPADGLSRLRIMCSYVSLWSQNMKSKRK